MRLPAFIDQTQVGFFFGKYEISGRKNIPGSYEFVGFEFSRHFTPFALCCSFVSLIICTANNLFTQEEVFGHFGHLAPKETANSRYSRQPTGEFGPKFRHVPGVRPYLTRLIDLTADAFFFWPFWHQTNSTITNK